MSAQVRFTSWVPSVWAEMGESKYNNECQIVCVETQIVAFDPTSDGTRISATHLAWKRTVSFPSSVRAHIIGTPDKVAVRVIQIEIYRR